MNGQDGGHGVSPLGVGVITIFMVLIVLCLSILATLTLSTARADLHLSQVNAETVTAYYEADAEAAECFARFAAGSEQTFETAIPMTENQSLVLHFGRDITGRPVVLEWKTVSSIDSSGWDEFGLSVWQGD